MTQPSRASYQILTGQVPPVVASRSARGRRAFLFLTGLMYLFVVAGFWPYWTHGGRLTPPRPWVIHLHAFIYVGWMALLLAQVLLVSKQRVDVHRRLGKVGIAWGIVVLCMGLLVALIVPTLHVVRGEMGLDEAAAFLIIPLGDMILFGSLFTIAVLNRKDSDIHRPCILMATVALMFAPVGRFAGPGGPLLILAVWMLPVIVAAAADWKRRPNTHPTYIIGSLWMLLMFARVAAMHTPFWLSRGRSIINALQPAVDNFF